MESACSPCGERTPNGTLSLVCPIVSCLPQGPEAFPSGQQQRANRCGVIATWFIPFLSFFHSERAPSVLLSTVLKCPVLSAQMVSALILCITISFLELIPSLSPLSPCFPSASRFMISSYFTGSVFYDFLESEKQMVSKISQAIFFFLENLILLSDCMFCLNPAPTLHVLFKACCGGGGGVCGSC